MKIKTFFFFPYNSKLHALNKIIIKTSFFLIHILIIYCNTNNNTRKKIMFIVDIYGKVIYITNLKFINIR
jgi:hypothetical protein